MIKLLRSKIDNKLYTKRENPKTKEVYFCGYMHSHTISVPIGKVEVFINANFIIA